MLYRKEFLSDVAFEVNLLVTEAIDTKKVMGATWFKNEVQCIRG